MSIGPAACAANEAFGRFGRRDNPTFASGRPTAPRSVRGALGPHPGGRRGMTTARGHRASAGRTIRRSHASGTGGALQVRRIVVGPQEGQRPPLRRRQNRDEGHPGRVEALIEALPTPTPASHGDPGRERRTQPEDARPLISIRSTTAPGAGISSRWSRVAAEAKYGWTPAGATGATVRGRTRDYSRALQAVWRMEKRSKPYRSATRNARRGAYSCFLLRRSCRLDDT